MVNFHMITTEILSSANGLIIPIPDPGIGGRQSRNAGIEKCSLELHFIIRTIGRSRSRIGREFRRDNWKARAAQMR
jgi:hypothetical protein